MSESTINSYFNVLFSPQISTIALINILAVSGKRDVEFFILSNIFETNVIILVQYKDRLSDFEYANLTSSIYKKIPASIGRITRVC